MFFSTCLGGLRKACLDLCGEEYNFLTQCIGYNAISPPFLSHYLCPRAQCRGKPTAIYKIWSNVRSRSFSLSHIFSLVQEVQDGKPKLLKICETTPMYYEIDGIRATYMCNHKYIQSHFKLYKNINLHVHLIFNTQFNYS